MVVAESCPLFRKPAGVGKTDKAGKKKKKKESRARGSTACSNRTP